MTSAIAALALTASLAAAPAPALSEGCFERKIQLTLAPGSSAACSAIGTEGVFRFDYCEGGPSGLLRSEGGRSRYLQAYGDAWIHRVDSYDPVEKRRALEALVLDPVRARFSHTGTVQVNGGPFERAFDCRGELSFL